MCLIKVSDHEMYSHTNFDNFVPWNSWTSLIPTGSACSNERSLVLYNIYAVNRITHVKQRYIIKLHAHILSTKLFDNYRCCVTVFLILFCAAPGTCRGCSKTFQNTLSEYNTYTNRTWTTKALITLVLLRPQGGSGSKNCCFHIWFDFTWAFTQCNYFIDTSNGFRENWG